MRALMLFVVAAAAGCRMLPPDLPPPPPVPPAGDTVTLFGRETPATADAIRAAVADRCPAGTPGAEAVERLRADGFGVWNKQRERGQWAYTLSAPLLLTSRWGTVQTLRVKLTEAGGPEEVWLDPPRRLPESPLLEACPDLRRLPGLPRADAEALLRANGFTVRETTTGLVHKATQLFARRWAEPSAHAASAVLVCRVEDGRIANLAVATADHPARGFDGLVGLFPARDAPAADQARAFAILPFSLAGMLGRGLLQWMAVPLAV